MRLLCINVILSIRNAYCIIEKVDAALFLLQDVATLFFLNINKTKNIFVFPCPKSTPCISYCSLYVHKEKLFYYFLKYVYCISRQIMKSLNEIHFIFLSSTFCTMMS